MRRFVPKLIPAAVAACLGSAAAPVAAEFPGERMYQTVEVGPGVYAFVSPETNGPIPSGNVLAVIGEDGVLVVDSGRFPTLARRMVAEIRRKTDKPVRYLVHTHWHLDHIAADGVFREAFPDMTFVASTFTRRKMVEKQIPYLKDLVRTDTGYLQYLKERVASGQGRDGSPMGEDVRRYLESQAKDVELEMAELSAAQVVTPALTFDREIRIYLGAREIRVAFLGRGNTEGDAVVFVPDARVVATGDLLVAPIPYGYGCHPAAWIQTLAALTAYDAAAIVPGHGPVQRDWSYAKKVSGLLEEIERQVSAQVRAGATLEETRERVDLSTFRKAFAGESFERGAAFDDFFVRSAVDRAYQEAKGSLAEE
ncbi:MAG TPA: MBL fold metallo-hydrolase [Thermoanaerobaculia bacterium]|nr:MBL fold metallo-hydrolase [Thermoanaerobaculia bacterium]